MQLLENIFSWRIPSLDDNNGFSPLYYFFTIITILIVAIILFKVKEQNENTVRWVVLGFGILFFVLELFKQLFYNVFDGWDGYYWHIFPFQVCSTPIYFTSLSFFFPHKIRIKFYSYLAFVSFLGGIAVLLFPSTVTGEEFWLCCDTLIWHDSMIILSFYLIKAVGFGHNIKETISAVFIFLIVGAMAMTMNDIFEICKQNNLVDGSFNMFMISPYYECTSPILKDILEATNWYLTWCVYFVAIISGILVYWCIIHSIRKLSNYLEKRKSLCHM